MNDLLRRINGAWIIQTAVWVLMCALLVVPYGCGCGKSDSGIPPAPEAEMPETEVLEAEVPEAESFAGHWELVVADLVSFRAMAIEQMPDAGKLAAFRARIRKNINTMRITAEKPQEKDFIGLAAIYLDDILIRLDEAVLAAKEDKQAQVEEASMQIGFILEEMHKVLKLTDL